MVVIPSKLPAPVVSHYGIEKHMKSSADRLFRLLNTYLDRDRTNRVNITTSEDLCKVVSDQIKRQRVVAGWFRGRVGLGGPGF